RDGRAGLFAKGEVGDEHQVMGMRLSEIALGIFGKLPCDDVEIAEEVRFVGRCLVGDRSPGVGYRLAGDNGNAQHFADLPNPALEEILIGGVRRSSAKQKRENAKNAE